MDEEGTPTRASWVNAVGTLLKLVVEEDRPVGIMTDRRIALALGETPNLADRQTMELADPGLVRGTVDTTVSDALELLREAGVRRSPVDDEGVLRGIVTLDDLIAFLSTEPGEVASVIERQSPRL
jgi:CBS domain-containing protein